jgi:hypothetical protein
VVLVTVERRFIIRKEEDWILTTFWWMIWKERNRRIFDQRESSAQRLANCILDSITNHQLARIKSLVM